MYVTTQVLPDVWTGMQIRIGSKVLSIVPIGIYVCM